MQCSTIGIAEKLDSINPSQLRFREIVATRTSVPPIIDGIIDAEVWENAKKDIINNEECSSLQPETVKTLFTEVNLSQVIIFFSKDLK